jgi:peptidyl-prolyl cis-trans isomerase SurA
MNEFHDGMLLFEISGEKVWNKVQEDTVGLKKYYEEHKHDFLSRRGIEAKLYTLRSKDEEKLLHSSYRKFSKKEGTDRLMLDKINSTHDSLLVITEGKWFTGDNPEIDNINWVTGPQYIRINNFPAVIVINKVMEPAPLPFEEIRGEMMTGYQEYLENEWLKQLKEKYTVKIDDLVFNEIKNFLKNE